MLTSRPYLLLLWDQIPTLGVLKVFKQGRQEEHGKEGALHRRRISQLQG
jgi:hypothetical protein